MLNTPSLAYLDTLQGLIDQCAGVYSVTYPLTQHVRNFLSLMEGWLNWGLPDAVIFAMAQTISPEAVQSVQCMIDLIISTQVGITM